MVPETRNHLLGIEAFLREAAPAALGLASSEVAAAGSEKTAKLDVFSYEIKFAVVTNSGDVRSRNECANGLCPPVQHEAGTRFPVRGWESLPRAFGAERRFVAVT